MTRPFNMLAAAFTPRVQLPLQVLKDADLGLPPANPCGQYE